VPDGRTAPATSISAKSKTWNDPAIASSIPKVKLPTRCLTVVRAPERFGNDVSISPTTSQNQRGMEDRRPGSWGTRGQLRRASSAQRATKACPVTQSRPKTRSSYRPELRPLPKQNKLTYAAMINKACKTVASRPLRLSQAAANQRRTGQRLPRLLRSDHPKPVKPPPHGRSTAATLHPDAQGAGR